MRYSIAIGLVAAMTRAGSGERLMATPARSEGKLYVRSERHVFTVGQHG